MRKFRPLFGILISLAIIALCYSPEMKTLLTLPEQQKMVVGESSYISLKLPARLENRIAMEVMGRPLSILTNAGDPPVSVVREDSGYRIVALKPGHASVQLRLLGYIPLKSMDIISLPPRRVVVGGHSIGVLLQSRGIMVVGFAPVIDSAGRKLYPARDQGVEIGDLIMKVNGQNIGNENDLARIIDTGKNRDLTLNIKRQDRLLSIPVRAAPCQETGRFRIGLFVRDGIVGVGTLTFWDPDTKEYAALGHIIVDADTRQGIDVLQGKIVSASIQTIKAGKPGQPGEKIGVFDGSSELEGTITRNTYAGISGRTSVDIKNPWYQYPLEVGYAHQVHTGQAQIFTVVNGNEIQKFNIVIEKVYPQRNNGKGMVIKVTDPRLLSLTGGIIQGMSGSPIIQDSRIVGAVTHVLLNDPTRGYGIFMDNMLSEIPSMVKNAQEISTNRKTG